MISSFIMAQVCIDKYYLRVLMSIMRLNIRIWLTRGGEGGDSLVKVGTDVRRVQNLGRAKFPQKT